MCVCVCVCVCACVCVFVILIHTRLAIDFDMFSLKQYTSVFPTLAVKSMPRRLTNLRFQLNCGYHTGISIQELQIHML